jgi:plasmid stability protein
MGKLIVELPEEIHKELKKKATLHHRTIKEVVTDLVEEYLSHREEKKNLKETGLCGEWEDKRSADAIIADIKSNRNWFGKGRTKGA